MSALEESRGSGQELERLVRRTVGLQPWRRIFHAGNGLVVALAPVALGASRMQTVIVLAAALVLLVALDIARLRVPRLNAFFFRAFTSLASPREAHSVASSTWYAMGVLATWALFAPAVAVPAILVLALADPAASVAGRLLKTPRIGTGSVLGCSVFFLVAAAILMPAAGLAVALPIAALTAAVEATPWKLDDNLAIPLAVGGMLSLMVG